MLVAISGGAGFLGLHLARRVLADGDAVRTLDLAPLEDDELERGVEAIRGDVRAEAECGRSCTGLTSSCTRRRRCRSSRHARRFARSTSTVRRRCSPPRSRRACGASS